MQKTEQTLLVYVIMEPCEYQRTLICHLAEDSPFFVPLQFVYTPPCTLQITEATLRQKKCADPFK